MGSGAHGGFPPVLTLLPPTGVWRVEDGKMERNEISNETMGEWGESDDGMVEKWRWRWILPMF